MTCLRGHPMPPDGRFCSICGSAPTTPAVQLPPRPSHGVATAALVLGIVGFIGSFLLIGLPFAVAAIALGAIGLGKRRAGRGLSISGLVLGIVGTSIALLLVIAAVILSLLGIDVTSIPAPDRAFATSLR